MQARLAAMALGLVLLMAVPGTVLAEKRVAFVIGNAQYERTTPLKNTVNDARAIAASLTRLGFEVTLLVDRKAPDITTQFLKFLQQLAVADVGLFYYAGHGLQYKEQNFLVGVDATLRTPLMLRYETLALNDIVDQMDALHKTSLIFWDACRDNPLAEELRRVRSLDVGRGAAAVEGGAGNTLIVFATTPGQVSWDGAGAHSPFAEGLLRYIEQPGLEVQQLLNRVAIDVQRATSMVKPPQRPERLSRMTADFFFSRGAPAARPGPEVIVTAESLTAEQRIRQLEAELQRLRGEMESRKDAGQQVAVLAPEGKSATRATAPGALPAPPPVVPPRAPEADPQPAQPPSADKPAEQPDPAAADRQACGKVLAGGAESELGDYLARNPSGICAADVRARLDALRAREKPPQVAVAPASPPPAPPAAEPARPPVSLSRTQLKPVLKDLKALRTARFSPDGTLLAIAGDDGVVRLWDAHKLELLHTLTGHKDRIDMVAFSADGALLASAGWDRVVRLWNARTGESIEELAAEKDKVFSVAFNPIQPTRYLVAGDGGGNLYVWDLPRKKRVGSWTAHQGPVHAISYLPGGKGGYMTAGGEGQMQFRWIKPGETLRTAAHTGTVFQAHYSADARLIVSAGGDKKVKVWDGKERTLLRTLEGHTRYVLTVAVSDDGRLVASGGGDKAIKLWDPDSGNLVRELFGHRLDVEEVAFSPGGKRLISVSEDKTAKVWDVATGRELATFIAFPDNEYVAYSPDGRFAGSANLGRHVRVAEGGIEVEIGDDYRKKNFAGGALPLP